MISHFPGSRNFLSSIEIFECSVNYMRCVKRTPVNSELKTNGTTQLEIRLSSLMVVLRIGELAERIPKCGWLCCWRICIQHARQLSRSVGSCCIYTMPFFRCVITLVYCSQTDLDVALLNATLYTNPFLWMACQCSRRRRRRRRPFLCHFMFCVHNDRTFAFKLFAEFCSLSLRLIPT